MCGYLVPRTATALARNQFKLLQNASKRIRDVSFLPHPPGRHAHTLCRAPQNIVTNVQWEATTNETTEKDVVTIGTTTGTIGTNSWLARSLGHRPLPSSTPWT